MKRELHLPETHVLLDGVDPGLEVGSGSIHVSDHRANVTNNGGKNQHTHLEDRNKSCL